MTQLTTVKTFLVICHNVLVTIRFQPFSYAQSILNTPKKVWIQLTELNLKGNDISGEIPMKMGDLQNLIYLDLSSNQLKGKVPASLANLTFSFLNLSNNQLFGTVPSGLSKFREAFIGNPKLCGEDFQDIKPCVLEKEDHCFTTVSTRNKNIRKTSTNLLLAPLAWFALAKQLLS